MLRKLSLCLISLYFDILLRKKSVYLLKTIIYLTFEKVNYQNIYILKKWNDWIKTVTRLDLNSWMRPSSNCIWVPIRSIIILNIFIIPSWNWYRLEYFNNPSYYRAENHQKLLLSVGNLSCYITSILFCLNFEHRR